MIIVYTPAGGEPEHYDARSLKVSEASIVARTVDQPWHQIRDEGLLHEDLDAMRGIVWVLKKRTQPSLRFGEFDPGVEEMYTRYDKQEIENYVQAAVPLARAEGLDDEQVLESLSKLPEAAIDPEHCEATIRRVVADPKDGPSPLTSSESSPETSAP
ncbi:hypothetical protein ABZ135_36525 [Streptomyces sp. NPDC006339]|uniref:hypothetical protein n=1 Tax=Streptomyces sp. NPDC006339 TaxID=3156755 RepID=UPI0033BEFB3E